MQTAERREGAGSGRGRNKYFDVRPRQFNEGIVSPGPESTDKRKVAHL